MLAFWFHELGLTCVSLTDLGSSVTEQGPSSMNRPKEELHPGPPGKESAHVRDYGR